MEPRQTAMAIRAVADEHMASAMRVSAAERGLDPESFTIVAFGGAAPLHACGVAERVGIRSVALPAEPGVLSAAGLASAPLAFDTVRTHRVLLDDVTGLTEVEEIYGSMRGELEARFSAYAKPEELVFHRTAGMRFRGQRDELDVRIPDGSLEDPATVQLLVEAFREAYLQHYARYPEVTIEITNWRLRAETHGEPLDTSAVRPESRPDYVPDETTATFQVDGELVDVVAEVKWRPDLRPGDSGAGPALLLEKHTTGVVPPSWSWSVRDDQALVITRNGEDRS
jgi:N-methylhydantoinase A